MVILIVQCASISLFLQEITEELPLLYRENGNGIYRTSAYFLAKNLAEVEFIHPNKPT